MELWEGNITGKSNRFDYCTEGTKKLFQNFKENEKNCEFSTIKTEIKRNLIKN